MYKIYLDSAQRYEKSVRLVQENGSQKVLGERSGDIDLVVSIKELLEEHSLKVSDIDDVVSNLGPGSFTGLKMSATIANVINWVNGKKTLKELDLPEYGSEPNITPKKF